MSPARFNVAKLVPLLERAHERLAGVVIECLPYGDFIARYKFPRSLVIVDSLPRNTTGKISKAELRKSAANLTVD